MSKERINVSVNRDKRNNWKNGGRREGLPMAKIIRRALDAYLAWDDPTYAPVRQLPRKERSFILRGIRRGLSGPRSVIWSQAAR